MGIQPCSVVSAAVDQTRSALVKIKVSKMDFSAACQVVDALEVFSCWRFSYRWWGRCVPEVHDNYVGNVNQKANNSILFHRWGTVSPWGKTGRSYRRRKAGCLTRWWSGSSCSCRNGSGRLNSGSWSLSGLNFGVWKRIPVCVAVEWLASLTLKHIIMISCTKCRLVRCCLVVRLYA